MNLRLSVLLFLLGICSSGLASVFQATPGYMDADYYLAGGQALVNNRLEENFIWNYLDDPAKIPHTAFAYWMPLPSFVAAFSMWVSGREDLAGARGIFILMAGLVPVITAWLAYRFALRTRSAVLAGLLAVFPGFYLVYLPAIDSFAISMVLGGLLFVAASQLKRQAGLATALGIGLLAGLLYLTRADGILWLPISMLLIWRATRKGNLVLLGLFAFLLVAGPWMARNVLELGSPLAPGGSRALWLTDYEDTFYFPAAELTLQRWWQSGLEEILRVRLSAAGTNALSALAVQGMIFLFPLMLMGLWKLRREVDVQIAAAAWALFWLVMSVVFPFQGARGAFFHSGAALQPVLWALAPVGLESLLEWGRQKRSWQNEQARLVFSVGLVGLALLLTILVAVPKLSNGAWNQEAREQLKVERQLGELGALPGEVVMVNNPPGFFLVIQRPAIAQPDGSLEQVLQAAEKYGAAFLILGRHHPKGLDELYEQPVDVAGLNYLLSVDGVHYFRFP